MSNQNEENAMGGYEPEQEATHSLYDETDCGFCMDTGEVFDALSNQMGHHGWVTCWACHETRKTSGGTVADVVATASGGVVEQLIVACEELEKAIASEFSEADLEMHMTYFAGKSADMHNALYQAKAAFSAFSDKQVNASGGLDTTALNQVSEDELAKIAYNVNRTAVTGMIDGHFVKDFVLDFYDAKKHNVDRYIDAVDAARAILARYTLIKKEG